jgi:hypothetical protein
MPVGATLSCSANGTLSTTTELSCGLRGLVYSGIDGFSDRRKLIAWDRPNDQLARIAGLS